MRGMNRRTVAVVLLGLLAAALGQQPAAAQTPRQNGYSFAAYWNGLYSDPNADRALAEMADMGVNWVSIVVTQYQDNIHSKAIGPTEGTPTDADVRHAIRTAHARGMKVMLKPHVDLWNDPDHWRGEIGPGFTAADWAQWFAAYRAFITHYAALAQDEGVEQFSVGVELKTTEGQAAQWRSTIAAVRDAFGGTLTYAGDWTSANGIGWWDALDLIGVDAYYPLAAAGNSTPTATQMANAWSPILNDLSALSAAQGNKPIIFTEIGYRSQDGAAQHPWEWQSGGAVDLAEQALLYRVAFEQVYNRPWFAGFYWWSWDPVPYQGGPCDNGYTVHDKPAEDVVREWYGAPPRDTSAPPPVNESISHLVYGDAPAAGWENWSWDVAVNFAATNQVYAGTKSIQIEAGSWGALSLHHAAVDTTPYAYLSFALRQSAATNTLLVSVADAADSDLLDAPAADCRYGNGAPLPANTWRRVLIPLDDLGAADTLITRLTFLNTGDAALRFWIDDLKLVAADESTVLPIILAAAHDGYVVSSAPRGNYGAKPTLRVRDAAADTLTYLKFDVAGLSAPPARATLRLYVTDPGPDGGAVYRVADTYRNSATPWVESGLKWNNAPLVSGVPLDSAGAVASRTWLELDVTAAVSGDGPVSLALRNASSNVVVYGSGESARGPELVVER